MNKSLFFTIVACFFFICHSHAAKVEDIFNSNCASCHGEDLTGAMAGSLLDEQWLTDGSDQALAKAIAEGIEGTSMPAFGDALSADTIRTLVVYIREARYKVANEQPNSYSFQKPIETQYHKVKLREVTRANGDIWALDFLPDGTLIYTVKQGELWTLDTKGNKTQIKNTPEVWYNRQGGLLDVYPDPDYVKNGWIYLSYSKPAGKNNNGDEVAFTAIVRGKIKDGVWTEQQTLFEAKPEHRQNRGWHFGSRFVIDGDYLFFTNGDEGRQDEAQDLSTQNGKIHRIFKDGRIPKDNPFYGQENAQQTIWTYGNRNPQGLTIHPKTRELWSTEHGPRGGDELNLVKKGANYGWPKVTFGMNYNGTPITPHTELPGMESPVHHWTPSIAVAGINFYTGNLFEHWQGDLFVGSLAKQQLHRIRLKDNQVIEDEVIFKGLGRIRDVVTAPNGEIYVTLNDRESGEGKIVALTKD
jgi:glucose/arabinose dehydrogenase